MKHTMLLASLCCCAHFLSAADPYIVGDDVEGESLEYYKTNRGVIAASEDLGNPSEIIMDGKRITGNTVTATGSDVSGGRDREVQGGYFSNTQPGGKVTISGSLFENNEFTATSYDSSVYCMLAKAPLTVVTDTNFIGNTVRLENASTSAGTIYGGVMGVNYGYSATFDNARFDSNKALGTFRVQGATLEVFTNSSLTVRNSSLTNNYGEALNAARGGGIENYNGSLTVENTSFSGNGVKAVTGFFKRKKAAVKGGFFVCLRQKSKFRNGLFAFEPVEHVEHQVIPVHEALVEYWLAVFGLVVLVQGSRPLEVAAEHDDGFRGELFGFLLESVIDKPLPDYVVAYAPHGAQPAGWVVARLDGVHLFELRERAHAAGRIEGLFVLEVLIHDALGLFGGGYP